MNKIRIVALLGESGSGKSAIAELLEKECGLKNTPSFTTRKERYSGEKGHIFTTEKQYQCNKANQIIIAETLFDGNRYWTTKGQFNGNCVYVVDPVGVKELKEKVKDAEIVIIYLRCDTLERFLRMSSREDEERAMERIGHDKEVFKMVQCDYVIDTDREMKEVLKDVKSIIAKHEPQNAL